LITPGFFMQEQLI